MQSFLHMMHACLDSLYMNCALLDREWLGRVPWNRTTSPQDPVLVKLIFVVLFLF